MAKTALIIGAHSDDQALGVGGTIAKLAKDGYEVHIILFFFFLLSHPHKKASEIRDIRRDESEKAKKILGATSTTFIDIPELSFKQHREKARNSIKETIEAKNPTFIFTHSSWDPHQDHQDVNQIVLSTVDEIETIETSVYVFDIWTVWRFNQRDIPRLYVDITDTFKKKVKALHEFKSQINVFSHTVILQLLYLRVYCSALYNGLRAGRILAEVFYKVR